MILAFEFQYISHNCILETLLQEICLDFKIPYKMTRNDLIVTLFVEEEEERLGFFADHLGNALPLSLFFKSSSVYVAQALPEEALLFSKPSLPIIFTPKILSEVQNTSSKNYLIPFVEFDTSCDVLEFTNTAATSLHAKDASGFESLYASVCEVILKGNIVEIRTRGGNFLFGTLENLHQLSSYETLEIVANDLSVVERLAVIRENEIKALASLERPGIRLKVNALFAAKEILPMQRVTLRLADDLIMVHLCKYLFEKGIQFIFKASAKNFKPHYSLSSTATLHPLEPLQISVLENGEIVLVKGASYASSALKESLKKFDEPSFGSYASIMQEHHLFNTSSACFYLSSLHDDKMMHYSKENGMLTLSSFSLPESFEGLFDAIRHSGKSGDRLVDNYKEAFPEIYARCLATPIPSTLPKSIYSLWKIASMVLGLSDNFEKAAEALIEFAEDFGGQKGPRIDYYLNKEDAIVSDFNAMKLIRSGISFKLAGTDEATLSFGYLQSLSYFLSDLSDSYKENLDTHTIALCGSLFGYRRLSEMVYKNIKPNHTICLNRELPIEYNA